MSGWTGPVQSTILKGPTGYTGYTGIAGPSGQTTGRSFFFDPLAASDIGGYYTALTSPSTSGETTLTTLLTDTTPVL